MDAYEHTHGFDRDGCIIGGKFIKYAALTQWYVCADCGGTPVHHIDRVDDATVDYAECAACGCRDFISQRYYDRQKDEFYEILEGLTPELRALVPQPEPIPPWTDEEIEKWDTILPEWLSSVGAHEAADVV